MIVYQQYSRQIEIQICMIKYTSAEENMNSREGHVC